MPSDEITTTVEGAIIAKRAALTDDQLRLEIAQHEGMCERAPGFASCLEAAKQLKLLVNEANRRGLGVVNKFPIIRG